MLARHTSVLHYGPSLLLDEKRCLLAVLANTRAMHNKPHKVDASKLTRGLMTH
jgi:hypothetical protein